jgi:hypothetical protein
MKKNGEWSYSSTILNPCTKGEWSASRPNRFTSRERASGTHWIAGWMDQSAGLDLVKNRKFLVPARNRIQIPRSSSPQTSLYTDWAIPARWDIRLAQCNKFRRIIVQLRSLYDFLIL